MRKGSELALNTLVTLLLLLLALVILIYFMNGGMKEQFDRWVKDLVSGFYSAMVQRSPT